MYWLSLIYACLQKELMEERMFLLPLCKEIDNKAFIERELLGWLQMLVGEHRERNTILKIPMCSQVNLYTMIPSCIKQSVCEEEQ